MVDHEIIAGEVARNIRPCPPGDMEKLLHGMLRCRRNRPGLVPLLLSYRKVSDILCFEENIGAIESTLLVVRRVSVPLFGLVEIFPCLDHIGLFPSRPLTRGFCLENIA